MTEKLYLLLDNLEVLKRKYYHSGKKYNKLNNLLIVPSIILTSSASIFSFLSTSDMISKEKQNDYLLTVAIITALSTLLQTINGACQFGIKKERFSRAANEFDSLVDKISFEIIEPNEDNFNDIIEEEIKKIKDNCYYLP